MTTSSRQPFGLFALTESTRLVLPLKGVKTGFVVSGGLVEVTVTQLFFQESHRPLDCQYLFPLPADAAVYSCEAFINDRVIRAQVEERQKAIALAEEKKQAGHRTALVESERENLFTLSLTNLQPQDLVEVRLAYLQPLRGRARHRSLEIPFCPGVRYVPGQPLLRSNRGKGIIDDTNEVPDASRITPVRIDADHPDAAYVEIDGRIEARFVETRSLVSPSHALAVAEEDGFVRVQLADQSEVPDRDFVLRWEESAAALLTPRAWTCDRDGETYALLEIRAPDLAPETSLLPQDAYFLVDRSGSMAGGKWEKAVEALQSCVRVLGPGDRAMITLFETRFRDFAEAPWPPARLLEDENFQRLTELGTAGGTELGSALDHVLKQVVQHSRGRRANLVLITDAQVGNDRAILEIMRQAPDLPVHCFGIDIALNDALLLALAQQQGGTFHSLNPHDDIPAAVAALGRTLGQPVLLDLKLTGGWDLSAARLPDLYAGQVHYASARRQDHAPLLFTARDASGREKQVEFAAAPAPNAGPFLHWCRTRIQRLLRESAESPQAIALSKSSNLVCELTAFVAWDEAEKVAVASHELVQPSMMLEAGMGQRTFLSFCRVPQELVERARCAYSELVGFSSSDSVFAGRDELVATAAYSSTGPTHEELERLRERLGAEKPLRELCDRVGGSPMGGECTAILDWVFAPEPPAERDTRLADLKNLLKTLTPVADEIAVVEADISRGLKDLPQRLRHAAADLEYRLKGRSFGSLLDRLISAIERRLQDVLPREPLERLQAHRHNLEARFRQIVREFMKQNGIPG